jgi:uncharacterized integral membrane protein
MLTKTRNTPAHSRAPEGIPDTITAPVSDEPRAVSDRNVDLTPPSAATSIDRETRRDRSRRKAHRSRLHAYAVLAVALVAFLIALAASNTAHVKVNWIFGTSHIALVWLVLFAAIVGWLLGLAATAAFHWRTRAPQRQQGAWS